MDLAVKCVECRDAFTVEEVARERHMLHVAASWVGCVGGRCCFWEPLLAEDGSRLGTKYYLAMQCASCLPPSVHGFHNLLLHT